MTKRIYAGIFAFIGLIGIIIQFITTYQDHGSSFFGHLIHFISFFTVTTNSIVVAHFFAHFWEKENRFTQFFRKPEVSTAITVYILIVGLVYQLVLAKNNRDVSWMLYSNHIVHALIPLAGIVFWILFVSHEKMAWRSVPKWLFYPLGYFAYILIRGAILNYYPYPFANVSALGYGQVFINVSAIVVVFLVFCIVFIAIANLRNRQK